MRRRQAARSGRSGVGSAHPRSAAAAAATDAEARTPAGGALCGRRAGLDRKWHVCGGAVAPRRGGAGLFKAGHTQVLDPTAAPRSPPGKRANFPQNMCPARSPAGSHPHRELPGGSSAPGAGPRGLRRRARDPVGVLETQPPRNPLRGETPRALRATASGLGGGRGGGD